MQIKKLNNDSTAMKALYFPKEPNSIANNKNIKNAVYNNKYIQSIAEKEDVLVRFMPKDKDFMQHLLILDIVDLSTKQTKKSMWFSSRLWGKFANISPEAFIDKISKPLDKAPKKSFWQKLFPKNPHQTEYFNYQEISPLKDDEFLLSRGLIKENNVLKEAESKRRKLNTQIIDAI